ncbi:MAG: aldo/keto reductase [Bacteroidetes bacterium]|nr:aldo/keto reductase [Bacteroidota bacterium]MDA1122307.1 aldo/keto reductase [Bacteroidota bacterium]
MKYREFGKTSLKISEVGFGAWAIGGPAMAGDIPIGWEDVDDRTSIAALKKAFYHGVNFFDTADFYGFGHSEELIGNLWGNRNDIIVATKVGQRMDANNNIYPDYSKKYVVKACEASLKRLKREAIDFYQLHTAKLDHLENGECIEAMDLLQQQGKIRYWGVSLNTYDPEPEADYMLSNNLGHGFQLVLNIINQKAMPLLKKASTKGMGIIARMPFQFGLLTGKFNKDSKFAKTDHRSFRLTPEILEHSLKDLEPVWSLAEKCGIDMDCFALSFVLSHPEVSTVIPGIKTPDQAMVNTKTICELSASDSEQLYKLNKNRFEKLLQFIKENG